MTAQLPPIPFKSTLLDKSGFLTPVWSGFFRQLYALLGQSSPTSLAVITTDIQNLETEVATLNAEVASQGSSISSSLNVGRAL